MEHVLHSGSDLGCNMQRITRKKRDRLELSTQTAIIADQIPNQSEVLMLREALKSERDSLHTLYRDLEEERGASMTAANEAMAMITRLQEEKAAVLLEARRYRRVAEERDSHNQEAISLLKEAVLTKEDDFLALQDLLNAYRERFTRIQYEQAWHHCDWLEQDGEKEHVLFLEGPNTMGMNSYCEKQFSQTMWRTDDGLELECQDESKPANQLTGDVSNVKLPGRYKEFSEVDHYIGKGQQEIFVGNQHNFHFEDTLGERESMDAKNQCEGQHSETEIDQFSGEISLEDVSVPIFARVKCLEERFEYLRQNQTLDHEMLNGASFQSDAMASYDMGTEEISTPDRGSVFKDLYNRKQLYCMESKKLVEVPVKEKPGEPVEDLECLAFERMDLGNAGQKLGAVGSDRGLENKCRRNMTNAIDGQRASFLDTSDDGAEGVHDVFEVQYEIKRLVVPPEHDVLGGCGKGMVEGVLPVPSNRLQPEGCTALNDKLSVDISSLDFESVRTNAADEDVRQLKVRLQALEDERVFMKEAIDSLGKENKELKVLQELAQQLRDLKGDVRRTQAPGQQDQLPRCSVFKEILSFAGFQNLAATTGSRCVLGSNCGAKKEKGGLLDILNKSSKIPKSVCITREHKVNFSGAIKLQNVKEPC